MVGKPELAKKKKKNLALIPNKMTKIIIRQPIRC